MTATPKSSPDAASALADLLDDYLGRGAPGLAVAIGTGAAPPHLSAAGFDDITTGAPLTPEHAMGAGSITKTFVAVLAMQLAEAGALDLAMPVGSALDPDAARGLANMDSATLAQLMNHTSGIASWEDDPRWIRSGRGAEIEVARVWSPSETLDYVRGKESLFAPGERYAYSNTNYTLLGLAIERLTGVAVGAQIAARICTPLGLDQTFLEGFTRPKTEPALAHRYHYKTPGFISNAGISPDFTDVSGALIDVGPSNLSTEWATGGLVTTVADLLSFGLALRAGDLVSRQSLDFMQAWRPADHGGFVGRGLFRRRVGPDWTIGHTGSVLGSSASFFWFEGQEVVVALLSNVGTMHIEGDEPGASSVGRDPRLAAISSRLAVDRHL